MMKFREQNKKYFKVNRRGKEIKEDFKEILNRRERINQEESIKDQPIKDNKTIKEKGQIKNKEIDKNKKDINKEIKEKII